MVVVVIVVIIVIVVVVIVVALHTDQDRHEYLNGGDDHGEEVHEDSLGRARA